MAKEVFLQPIIVKEITVTIESISPLIQHKWSEKARSMIRDKKAGKKTRTRENCDPLAEARAATHLTDSGEYGLPVLALKAALISAAHKDLGIEKTLVRKSLFIPCTDDNGCVPMRTADPKVREDAVRIGAGSADLRYRPEFAKWEADIPIHFDSAMLTETDIVNLINRAGFGGGIGEWRPEKGGDFGRFRVKA